MKIKLILIALTIGMMGCDEPNVEQKPTKHNLDGHSPLDEVTIEGCQYLLGEWGNATVLTHKGNCDNPIHKHNESQE